jgi:hypothetical protein
MLAAREDMLHELYGAQDQWVKHLTLGCPGHVARTPGHSRSVGEAPHRLGRV